MVLKGALENSGRAFLRGQRRMLVTTIIGYTLFYFLRKNLSLAMPGLAQDYGITKTTLGIFLTLHGVVDATCGAAFRAAFSQADLIVAKGQANFETMSDRTDKPIAFLFLAKCPVVCREVGAQPQTIQVVLHNF